MSRRDELPPSRTSVGTAIVSYMEPSPGYAREFNRWYEDDHFPCAVLAGPGVLAGARFVATRECKALRPDGSKLFGEPSRGSYLGIALVEEERQHEWDAWVVGAMEKITAEGRLFPHREHIHTAIYRLQGWRGAPPEQAFDGSAPGVIVFAQEHRIVPLVDEHTVAFELERTIISSAAPPQHQLTLSLCASDPIELFRNLPRREGAGFASPFLATIPGTDAYTEEL